MGKNIDNTNTENTDKKLNISDVIKLLDMLQFKAFDIDEDGEKTEWVYGKYIEHDEIRNLIEELKNTDFFKKIT